MTRARALSFGPLFLFGLSASAWGCATPRAPGLSPPAPRAATATSPAPCAFDDARELDAIRAVGSARGLAERVRRDREVLAFRRYPRTARSASFFADAEAEAEERLTFAERYALATIRETIAAERAVQTLVNRCTTSSAPKAAQRPAKPTDTKTCAAIAQTTTRVDWYDPRLVTSLADDLERLERTTSHDAELSRAAMHTRALAVKLDVLGPERARLVARREVAERTLARGDKELGCDARVSLLPAFVAAKTPDPRKLTVVVVARPPRELVGRFESAARETTERELAAAYRSVANGRVGSGFLLVRAMPNGERKSIIVTNRHVIDYAETSSIVLGDGTRLEADLTFIDPLYDLAIVEPRDPGGKLESAGFRLSARAPRDGEPVTATGYPVLLGVPSFQLTKGHVSNERLAFASLLHLQHTASVDPGSSGGPLVAENGDVVGVNTFKISERENVNVSVPVGAVARALLTADRARECDGTCRKERARDACLALVPVLGANGTARTALQRLLGRDLVASRGFDAQDGLLEKDARIRTRFRSSPVGTLSEVVATFIADDVRRAGGVHPLEVCTKTTIADTTASAEVVLADGTTRILSLRWEASRWVLADYKEPKALQQPVEMAR